METYQQIYRPCGVDERSMWCSKRLSPFGVVFSANSDRNLNRCMILRKTNVSQLPPPYGYALESTSLPSGFFRRAIRLAANLSLRPPV